MHLTALSVGGVFIVALVVETIPVKAVADETVEDVGSLDGAVAAVFSAVSLLPTTEDDVVGYSLYVVVYETAAFEGKMIFEMLKIH